MNGIVGVHLADVGRSFLLILMSIMVLGCSGSDDAKVVDFNRTIPIKRPGEQRADADSLRVAIGSMISPKETFYSYQQIVRYMGDQLGMKTKLIQRKTYGEINELLSKGEVDLAFICSGPYAVGKEEYDLQLLAAPQIHGNHFYHSYLIVNAESSLESLEDLKGRVFAFTDPDSNTGKLVPTYWLMQMNERPEKFFSEIIYTYSHDNSILAVARGLVDGAAVHGLIWEYYKYKNPLLTAKTKIIRKSIPYGIPPLVTSTFLPDNIRERLAGVFFSMHTTPEGQNILKELMIDKFIPAQEEWYDSIRKMQLTLARSKELSHEAERP